MDKFECSHSDDRWEPGNVSLRFTFNGFQEYCYSFSLEQLARLREEIDMILESRTAPQGEQE